MQTDVRISLLYDRIVELEQAYNQERDRADVLAAANAQLRTALEQADSIMWMAERYAEGGEIEMSEYRPVADAVRAALEGSE